MQQPPDPYSQFQQPYNAPTSPYTQQPPTPGQFQYPPPYNYNQPPKPPSGFRHWLRTRSRNTKIGLGCGTLIAALLLCICAASAYGSSTVATTLTPTPTATATTAAISQAIPTDTPTIAPTDTPTPIPTLKPTPTQPPTQPTVAPTQAATAPIPSASELSQLFSAKDGSVTNVNINKIANGSTGVAHDVQVNNPTQTSVKHINYILLQFFFGSRTDVGLVNIAFHADGYTGMDDPIAQGGGVSSQYSLGLDENQLWDTLGGVFNANLPS